MATKCYIIPIIECSLNSKWVKRGYGYVVYSTWVNTKVGADLLTVAVDKYIITVCHVNQLNIRRIKKLRFLKPFDLTFFGGLDGGACDHVHPTFIITARQI